MKCVPRIGILALCIGCLALSHYANAQGLPEIESPGAVPMSIEDLPVIKRLIETNPNNLDNYFNYAQTASSLNQYQEAKEAYLHMLAVDPFLHRVKLDLGLLYVRTGQYEDAKILFQEVLDTSPPEEVKQKIERLLVQIDKDMEKHQVTGGVAVGYNYDTNASSAPDSGNVTFNDIDIPLGDSSGDKSDGHYFANATLNYRYRGDTDNEDIGVDWNVTGTAYQTKQNRKDTQDLLVLGVKAGPTIELKSHKTKIGLNGGYQWVQLDDQEYLNLFSLELTTNYLQSKHLSLFSVATYEKRHFINSRTSSSLSDRSGEAYQAKAGFNYLLKNKDVVGASIQYRREDTRVGYLSNDQINVTTNYTHVFGQDIFTNLLLGYKRTYYDELDVFISSLTKREDEEKYVVFTLGKKFKSNITLTLGYQYRNVTSSIQNYEYDNHRTTVAMGWNF